MFIDKKRPLYRNPEGILCKKRQQKHKIPSGLGKNALLNCYKYRFPSGIIGCLYFPTQNRYFRKLKTGPLMPMASSS
jgi:hypothetical protein